MEMYPKNNLYELYKKNVYDKDFSHRIPDITKKRTLEVMNLAVNACEKWDTVLDIGGGSGHYSIPLLEKFKKVVLVDTQVFEEHSHLKNKYPHFEHHNSFIEHIDFKEKFGFILLADIFEHIEDISSFIKKIAQLQDKNGVIYILTPNPLFCGPAVESGIYYTRHKDGHRKHYLPHEIKTIMGEYGYEFIYSSYEEAPLRQEMKRIVKGLSRRDRRWGDSSWIYKNLISPVCMVVVGIFLFLVEVYVYRNEIKNKNNQETTMASTYIFKKKSP